MTSAFDDTIRAIEPELVALRRDFHAHPETGFEERRTAGIVADRLRGWGLDVANTVAATYGCTAELQYERIFSALVNDAGCTQIAVQVAEELVGASHVNAAVQPVTGSEDFAFMLEKRPGNYIFLGNGVAEDGSYAPVHTPGYDFNDAALPLGVRYWVALVQQELGA